MKIRGYASFDLLQVAVVLSCPRCWILVKSLEENEFRQWVRWMGGPLNIIVQEVSEASFKITFQVRIPARDTHFWNWASTRFRSNHFQWRFQTNFFPLVLFYHVSFFRPGSDGSQSHLSTREKYPQLVLCFELCIWSSTGVLLSILSLWTINSDWDEKVSRFSLVYSVRKQTRIVRVKSAFARWWVMCDKLEE